MANNVNFTQWHTGSHLGFGTEITPTIIDAVNKGLYSVQFCMGDSTKVKRQRINLADIDTSQCLIEKYPMNVFTHFPFTVNLNGSTKSLAWSGDDDIDRKLSYTLSELEYELSVMSHFSENSSGVVIHPGSYRDTEKGLACVAKSINKLDFSTGSKLILENCANEGTKLCKNFSEIQRIIDQVSPNKRNHIGVCVDTAHTFAAGIYDLREIAEIDRMFADFDRELGLDKLTLLHLNDSDIPFGKKRDRHERLGAGWIWGENCSSLVYLLDKCEELGIPSTLETTPLDIFTLNELYEKTHE